MGVEIRTGEAAKGWDELCRLAPANTLVAYEELRRREIEQEPRAPAKSCVMPADLRFQGEMMLDGERGLERARPSR